MNKANANKLGYVGKINNRDSNAWFTPLNILNHARQVIGPFQLDPYSSKKANKIVKADAIYTREDPAPYKWKKANSVWINPPYGRGIFSESIQNFLRNYKTGRINNIIALVNNVTETKAGQSLMSCATTICFPAGRISFYNTDGKATSGNTRGQMILLFTDSTDKINTFTNEFEKLGIVWRKF